MFAKWNHLLYLYIEPTSYDYDAPISEAGVRTKKFYSFKKIIHKYLEKTEFKEEEEEPSAAAYGEVTLAFAGSIFLANGTAGVLEYKMTSEVPPTFGDLWQDSGFVLYETTVPSMFRQPEKLEVDGLRDRGYVFVDGKPQV